MWSASFPIVNPFCHEITHILLLLSLLLPLLLKCQTSLAVNYNDIFIFIDSKMKVPATVFCSLIREQTTLSCITVNLFGQFLSSSNIIPSFTAGTQLLCIPWMDGIKIRKRGCLKSGILSAVEMYSTHNANSPTQV